MKTLVIGSEGSTGKRYCRILGEMGHDVIKYDIGDMAHSLPSYDKVIIATPTKTHREYFYLLPPTERDNILVEKPAAATIDDLNNFDSKMVCNWAFVFPDRVLKLGKHHVYYCSKYHGKEGYWFDTCQLHILSNGRGEIHEGSLSMDAAIDGEIVTLPMIEASYVRMIDAWLYRPDEILNVQDLIPELSYIIRKQEIENEQK